MGLYGMVMVCALVVVVAVVWKLYVKCPCEFRGMVVERVVVVVVVMMEIVSKCIGGVTWTRIADGVIIWLYMVPRFWFGLITTFATERWTNDDFLIGVIINNFWILFLFLKYFDSCHYETSVITLQNDNGLFLEVCLTQVTEFYWLLNQ